MQSSQLLNCSEAQPMLARSPCEPVHYKIQKNMFLFSFSVNLHGWSDSNARHLVLETSALPTELHPCLSKNLKAGLFQIINPGPNSKPACLFNNINHLAGSNSPATLTDCKTKAFINGNRINKFNDNGYIITRHYHLSSLRKQYRSGYI